VKHCFQSNLEPRKEVITVYTNLAFDKLIGFYGDNIIDFLKSVNSARKPDDTIDWFLYNHILNGVAEIIFTKWARQSHGLWVDPCTELSMPKFLRQNAFELGLTKKFLSEKAFTQIFPSLLDQYKN
jgi:hypothetical protein